MILQIKHHENSVQGWMEPMQSINGITNMNQYTRSVDTYASHQKAKPVTQNEMISTQG